MKRFFTLCLSALLVVAATTSCEKEITPDPTAPARTIYNQTRQYLMTPITVVELAVAFNEYYLAPTEKMRNDIEDKYFPDYKIRFDTESGIWRLERNNRPVVRIQMEGGKALNTLGSKWSFLPGTYDLPEGSEITLAYKADGVYSLMLNSIPAYGDGSDLRLSGSLEVSPKSGSMLLNGQFTYASTKSLYKVTNRIGDNGLLVRQDVENPTEKVSWYNYYRNLVNGSWVSTVVTSQAETIAFTSIADCIWRIEYFAANGVHYLGYCNSSAESITGPIESELYY